MKQNGMKQNHGMKGPMNGKKVAAAMHEVHHHPPAVVKKTANKKGAAAAKRQMTAIALNKARRARAKIPGK